MTAVLRHVPALRWLGLLQPLCHVNATSVAANPVFSRPTMTLPTFTSWYVVRLTVGSLFTPVGHKPSVRDISRWLIPL